MSDHIRITIKDQRSIKVKGKIYVIELIESKITKEITK